MFSDTWSDIFLALFLAAQRSQSGEIDSGISQAIRDSTKISMSKNIFSDSRIETTITAEEISFKRNTVDVWPKVFLSNSLVILASIRKIFQRTALFI